ncbi:MAG: DUF3667 domain-containing protein [Gammaproteobacteria bacterium]
MADCLNCGSTLETRRFCAECGQSGAVARLGWRDIVTHLRDQLFDGNLPWLRTVRELTVDPGGLPRRFVAGRRSAYVHPLKYAFYTILLYSLLTTGPGAAAPAPDLPAWRNALAVNLPVFLLLVTPVAVASLRICFARTRINTVETWAFVLYVLGHISLFYLLHRVVTTALRIFGPLGDTAQLVLGMAAMFVPLVYFMVATTRFYDVRLYYALLGALVATVATAAAGVYLWVWLVGGF